MGREARVALILTAAGCLLAVLVDWAVAELNGEATQPGTAARSAGAAASDAGEASQVSVEAAQKDAVPADTGEAQDATAELHDQGSGSGPLR
jgi:hypothetical protein